MSQLPDKTHSPRLLQSSACGIDCLPHERAKAADHDILDRIKIVLAAYSKNEVADPEGWGAQVAVVLARFPKEVVDYVTDPWTGVQSFKRWGVPNVADFREACDERMAQLRTEYDKRHSALPAPVVDRSGHPSGDELRAKFGPNWGLKTTDDILTPIREGGVVKRSVTPCNAPESEQNRE
jgi:hypothetical protein